jgi:serine phosphatase RsbU (regulator of sigma subunit)
MISAFQYDKATEGRLEPGDFLALVTDGFFEWENPEGEQYGLTRLDEILRESHELSAENVIGRLRESVAEFCKGTTQMDDLTAVILKRKNGSPAAGIGQSSA